MTLFSDDLAQNLAIVGMVLLIIEVAILGFSTFFLTFLGLSLLTSSLFMYWELIPTDWVSALLANAVLTTLYAALMWKPLKRMQEAKAERNIHNDFAEITFTLEQDVTPDSSYSYEYSGVHWRLKSQQPLKQGTQVKVVKKDVGVFWIEPL
ncbi:NfeD family protein [Alteromonas sp. a30]|uniref:NfeD family protein n=1 Tax=Alteromonas sp. a30 TaxID=2730917 RepID=UPI0022826DDB|nr:NfeD family protein [Alteromonas sp. a30]MCY7294890.1 NfeD family protein [Alteromonas sp. a30]